jgi:hypothetical protein
VEKEVVDPAAASLDNISHNNDTPDAFTAAFPDDISHNNEAPDMLAAEFPDGISHNVELEGEIDHDTMMAVELDAARDNDEDNEHRLVLPDLDYDEDNEQRLVLPDMDWSVKATDK